MWETAKVLDRKTQTLWTIKTYEGILTPGRKTFPPTKRCRNTPTQLFIHLNQKEISGISCTWQCPDMQMKELCGNREDMRLPRRYLQKKQ